MLYNVAQLLKDPPGAVREYRVDESLLVPEEGWGPLHLLGEVRMLRALRSVLVTATLTTVILEECSRCLERHQQPLSLGIEEEFFPITDANNGLSLAVPEGAGPFTVDAKHLLDLTEALRQAVLVAKPLQPLCRAECAGLCPECGQNRNLGSCACPEESLDARWGALQALSRNT